MTDTNVDRHLFKVLGALGSDVKHSLSLLERSRQDTSQLRSDMKQDNAELRNEFRSGLDKVRSEHGELTDRVEKLENWQTRMMAYMTLLIPAAIVLGQAIAPFVLNLLSNM